MDTADWLAHLRADIDALAATRSEDLERPVPACPGWTVADLIDHVNKVHRFATAQLLAAPGSERALPEPRPDGAALDVFTAGASRLVETLAATDPDEHRPNWAGAPTARFWWRRMAQEIAVHRADRDLAVGVDPVIDPELAVDGIDEFADVFLSRWPGAADGAAGAAGPVSVHLHATDVEGGEWTFHFGPQGPSVTREHGKGDMAVRGPADQLLLFVWNRRPVHVECFGDLDPLEWWPANLVI